MAEKSIPDLPAAEAAEVGDLYHCVQSTDRKQTLQELRVAVGTAGTNLEALLNLIGAADKLGYFVGGNAMGVTAFTATGRSLVGQADLDAVRALLDITRNRLGARSRDNLLDNPNFRVNQRGYVSGTATVGALQPTLDRWKVVTSGQSLVYATSGAGNSVTCPVGGLEQAVEGANIATTGVHTLSWTGTATATVNGVAVVNGGQTASLPAGTDALVRFINGTLSQPKLEFGAVVSAFEGRPLSEEIRRCERWYETGNVTYSGNVTSASTYTATDKFRTLKKGTPTVVLASVYATNFGTGTLASTNTTRDITISRVATGTGNGAFGISYTADAE